MQLPKPIYVPITTPVFKAAIQFVISIWYFFLTSCSFGFLRLYIFRSNVCAAYLHTANLFLTIATTRYISVLQSAPLKLRTSSIIECHLLSFSMWSMWLWVFPSGELQVYLWMFRCGNIVLLTRFLCCKVYYSNTFVMTILMQTLIIFVGLKIFSYPTFALKSPNRFFVWHLGQW
jgi:hypothetical protein